MATLKMKVLVLVKAMPVVTSDIEEYVCVAGIRLDCDSPSWVRLYPVPFRDLSYDSKFAKYQIIEVNVKKSSSDRRPESWKPIHGSITLGRKLSTKNDWFERRQLVESLGELSMCQLNHLNLKGSGEGVPSLGVVRPRESPTLKIERIDNETIAKRKNLFEAEINRPSLFDDLNLPKSPLEVVPYKFQYEYKCGEPNCKGHSQSIIDWEIVALYRNVRNKSNWKESITQRYEIEMWSGRDSVLFVGNQHQYPGSFLVLGVFWPPLISQQSFQL